MADEEREAHSSDAPLPFPTVRQKIGEPLPDAVYASSTALLAAYQAYAYNKGYGVVLNAKNKNKEGARVIYMCDKGGKPRDRKNNDLHPSKKRPNTGSRKTDCPYRIIAQEQGEGGTWRGYILEEHHNHEPSDDPIAHPSNRTKKLGINQEALALVLSLLSRQTPVSTIRAQLREKWGVELTPRDVYNMGQKIRTEELGGKTPINWLADELENRAFFVRIDTDENNRVTRLFFAHPVSIQLLKKHPNVVLIDCTYKTNRFNMPMVNICGSSGDNKTPQFAVAFKWREKGRLYLGDEVLYRAFGGIRHLNPSVLCYRSRACASQYS